MYLVTVTYRERGGFTSSQFTVDGLERVVREVIGNVQTVTVWKGTEKIAIFSGPEVQVVAFQRSSL